MRQIVHPAQKVPPPHQALHRVHDTSSYHIISPDTNPPPPPHQALHRVLVHEPEVTIYLSYVPTQLLTTPAPGSTSSTRYLKLPLFLLRPDTTPHQPRTRLYIEYTMPEVTRHILKIPHPKRSPLDINVLTLGLLALTAAPLLVWFASAGEFINFLT